MSTAATAKRGPYAPSIKRRETVVRAVLELVDELGHESVTTALVSQRSAVSETTVLYHFPSKDHLLVAALARAEDLAAEMSRAYGPDAVLDASALGRTTSEDLQGRRHRLFLMLKGQAATPDHPAGEYFAQRTVRQVALFAQLIEHSQREGIALQGLDPNTTARQAIAVWEGLSQMWMSDPSFEIGPVLEDAVRRLTGHELIGIQAMLDHSLSTPSPRQPERSGNLGEVG